MAKSKKKNKKGFSLVELIIVIAIMVALITVMAPSFVKYVQKARDAVIQDAAEQCIDFVKAEYGVTINGEGTVRIGKGKGDQSSFITLTFQEVEKDNGTKVNTLNYTNEVGESGIAAFKADLGFADGKMCKSDLVYLIHIQYYEIDNHPQLELEAEEADADTE